MNSSYTTMKPPLHRTVTTIACVLVIFSGCNSQEKATVKKADSPLTKEDATAVTSRSTNSQDQTAAPTKAEPAIPLQNFLDAALNGDTDMIQSALNSKFDVNSTNEQNRSAVMLAAFNGHTNIVKLLVRNGASPNLRDSSGRTALMFAATGDNSDTVEFLIVSGAELDAVDNSEGFTALMFAAAEGQTEVVRTLLKYKADPSIKDADGESAFGFANKNGHVEAAKLLSN